MQSHFHFYCDEAMRRYLGQDKPARSKGVAAVQTDMAGHAQYRVQCHLFAPGRGIWGPTFVIFLDVRNQYCMVATVPAGLRRYEIVQLFQRLYQEHLAFQLFQAGFRASQVFTRARQHVDTMLDKPCWLSSRHPELLSRLTHIENCLLEELEYNKGKTLSTKQLFVLALLLNDLAVNSPQPSEVAMDVPSQLFTSDFIQHAENDVFASDPANVICFKRSLN